MSETQLDRAEGKGKVAVSDPGVGTLHSRLGKAKQQQERHEQGCGPCPGTQTLSFTGNRDKMQLSHLFLSTIHGQIYKLEDIKWGWKEPDAST